MAYPLQRQGSILPREKQPMGKQIGRGEHKRTRSQSKTYYDQTYDKGDEQTKVSSSAQTPLQTAHRPTSRKASFLHPSKSATDKRVAQATASQLRRGSQSSSKPEKTKDRMAATTDLTHVIGTIKTKQEESKEEDSKEVVLRGKKKSSEENPPPPPPMPPKRSHSMPRLGGLKRLSGPPVLELASPSATVAFTPLAIEDQKESEEMDTRLIESPGRPQELSRDDRFYFIKNAIKKFTQVVWKDPSDLIKDHEQTVTNSLNIELNTRLSEEKTLIFVHGTRHWLRAHELLSSINGRNLIQIVADFPDCVEEITKELNDALKKHVKKMDDPFYVEKPEQWLQAHELLIGIDGDNLIKIFEKVLKKEDNLKKINDQLNKELNSRKEDLIQKFTVKNPMQWIPTNDFLKELDKEYVGRIAPHFIRQLKGEGYFGRRNPTDWEAVALLLDREARKKIKVFDCRNLNLNYLPRCIEMLTFPKAKSALLGGNLFTKIPDALRVMTPFAHTVSFSRCQITECPIDIFFDFHHMTTFDLSYQNYNGHSISEMPYNLAPGLQADRDAGEIFVNLSGNAIKSVDIQAFSPTTRTFTMTFDLKGNPIQRMPKFTDKEERIVELGNLTLQF